MHAESTVLAYLAGMIDGDGYISITESTRNGKKYFAPQVGIAGTRSEPHDLAASIFGGSVSRYTPKNPEHRPQYQWSRVGRAAIVVITSIRPYLRVKAEQADLACQLWEHVELARADDPFPWLGPTYSPLAAAHEMRQQMISLNQSRNRVGKKAAGRLLDGREWHELPATQGANA